MKREFNTFIYTLVLLLWYAMQGVQGAAILDWDGSTWPGPEDGSEHVPGQPSTYTIFNAGSSGIDVTFSWDADVPFAGGGGSGPSFSPHDDGPLADPSLWTNILEDGFTPSSNYLAWRQDTVELDPQVLTMSFSMPITNLRFLMYDIDNGGNGNYWTDRLTLDAYGMAGTVSPDFTLYRMRSFWIWEWLAESADPTNNGQLLVNGNTITANVDMSSGNQDPGTAYSTALVEFGVDPITSLTIAYDSLNVSNPSSQFIGFSAFVFEPLVPDPGPGPGPIPEPGSLTLLLIGACALLRRSGRP